jgi:hypothetical protein
MHDLHTVDRESVGRDVLHTDAPALPGLDGPVELHVSWIPTYAGPLHRLSRAWSGHDPDAQRGATRGLGPRVVGRFDEAGDRRRSTLQWTPEIPHLGASLLRSRTVDVRRSGLIAPIRPGLMVRGDQVIDTASTLGRVLGRHAGIMTAPLQLAWSAGRLTIMPERPSDALIDLAHEVTTALEPLRVPLDDVSVAEHRMRGLSLRQELMLLRWGHPDAFDEFQFRILLTDPVPESERRDFEIGASSFFAPVLGHGLSVDEFALLRVTGSSGSLATMMRAPLAASTAALIPA